MNSIEKEWINGLIAELKPLVSNDETVRNSDPCDMRGVCDLFFRNHPSLEHRLGLLSGRDVPSKVNQFMDWTESSVYRKSDLYWNGKWSVDARPLTHCQLLFILLSCTKKTEFI